MHHVWVMIITASALMTLQLSAQWLNDLYGLFTGNDLTEQPEDEES